MSSLGSNSPEHNFRVHSLAQCIDEMERKSSFALTPPDSPIARSARRSRSSSTEPDVSTDEEDDPRMKAGVGARYADARESIGIPHHAFEFCEAGEQVRRAKLDLQLAEQRFDRARDKLIPVLAKGPQKIDLNRLDAKQLSRIGGAGTIELRIRDVVSKGPPSRLTAVDVEKAVVMGLRESGESKPEQRLALWIDRYKESLCPAKGLRQRVSSVFRRFPRHRFVTMPAIAEEESQRTSRARSYPRSPEPESVDLGAGSETSFPGEQWVLEDTPPPASVSPSSFGPSPSSFEPAQRQHPIDFNFGAIAKPSFHLL